MMGLSKLSALDRHLEALHGHPKGGIVPDHKMPFMFVEFGVLQNIPVVALKK
jgi:hypothetical protein